MSNITRGDSWAEEVYIFQKFTVHFWTTPPPRVSDQEKGRQVFTKKYLRGVSISGLPVGGKSEKFMSGSNSGPLAQVYKC